MKQALFYLVLAVLSYALVYASQSALSITGDKLSSRVFLIPPKQVNHLHFGYRETLADSLWIRVVQDLDVCEQGPASKQGINKTEPKVSNDEEKANGGPSSEELKVTPDKESKASLRKRASNKNVLKDNVDQILSKELVASKCNKGWVYQMLDRITDLAPRFKVAYTIGGTMLSVVVDDREGARLLLDKGIKRFPESWRITYQAAYHYLYEIQDPKRAAQLLELAAKNGAPPWVYSLSASLYSKSGRAELGISVLENAILNNPKGFGNDRIGKRLFDLYNQLNEDRQKRGLPLREPRPEILEAVQKALEVPDYDPYKDSNSE